MGLVNLDIRTHITLPLFNGTVVHERCKISSHCTLRHKKELSSIMRFLFHITVVNTLILCRSFSYNYVNIRRFSCVLYYALLLNTKEQSKQFCNFILELLSHQIKCVFQQPFHFCYVYMCVYYIIWKRMYHGGQLTFKSSTSLLFIIKIRVRFCLNELYNFYETQIKINCTSHSRSYTHFQYHFHHSF